MRLSDGVATALRSLFVNPMRTALTMLGIIIGVASVIAMTAVGEGAQAKISDEIKSFGANVLVVNPGESNRSGVRLASGAVRTLTQGDAAAIAELPLVKAVAPCVWGTAQVVRRDHNWNATIVGSTAAQFSIRDWRLQSGRFFSRKENGSYAKVAVLGATTARKLFGPQANGVGRTIRILNAPFKVIGILRAKGPLASGQDQDDVVFVPLSAARVRLIGDASPVNGRAVAYILVKADAGGAVGLVKAEIDALLRQRHRLPLGRGDDFIVNDPAALMAAQNASTRTVAILLAAIASVSLLVGGISIMNIMLVSVTERTREIGLRMAVGARRCDIRNQFLLESVTLCLAGGLVGMAAGAAAALAIAKFATWPVYLGPGALFLALGFAGGTGVFFGWYPARRAALLAPALALRSE